MANLSSKKLEEQRAGLIRYIELKSPQGNNSVTIVFDGKEDVYSPAVDSKVRIIYTKGESADEKIKKMVKASSQVKSIVVVTDDRDIQYSVRAAGAKISSVHDFLHQKPAPKSGRSRKVSRESEQKINEELKDIWLKDNNE